MRIIIDLQGLQSPFSGTRGVGRYTENLVKSILKRNKIGHEHEIFLALNGVFPDSVLDIRDRFKGLIDPECIVVWQQFYDPNPAREPHPAIIKAAKVTREIFLNSYSPDLIFSTNLQEGLFDASITGVKSVNSCALYWSTLHDVVPYFYPEYIAGAVTERWYNEKISDALKSDLIITVSKTSRDQIIEKTNADPNKVVSIYNGVDVEKFNTQPIQQEMVSEVLGRLAVNSGYIFYYGGCDKHKNLPRLIRAYASVRDRILNAPKLVLGGRDVAADEVLSDLIRQFDLDNFVHRPGFISDEDLPVAIKSCKAFVFPSLHEGFGLPALEAMACGIPTLGASGTSVAEIIGDKEALFDGTDEASIANLIIKVLQIPAFCEAMGERAARRAREFCWDRSAEEFFKLLDRHKIESRREVAADAAEVLRKALFWELPALGERTKAAIAHSLAESLPSKRSPRFLLDISTVVNQDDRSGIQRVTRAICQELLSSPPAGFEVVPVYSKKASDLFFEANSYARAVFGTDNNFIDHAVEFQRGDILLYLDLNPGVAISKREYNKYLRVKGVKVVHVVYDLLPLLRPSTFWPELCMEFQEWIRVVSASDGAICISRSVASELKDYLSSYGEKRNDKFKIGWFHLGADIDNSAPSKGLPENSSWLLEQVRNVRSFLMVGTVEPRKGHRQTLAAFNKLWNSKEYEDVGLFIVGRLGWGMHDFADELRSHPEFGRRLHWLSGISDEYLEAIYSGCDALIAASDGEGFGLPLIEAAQRKKPLIARDIPVFREVAGEHAFFFANEPHPEIITEAVIEWLRLFKAGRHPSSDNMPWLRWKDSAARLTDVVINDGWDFEVSSEGLILPGAKINYDTAQIKWKGFATKETGFRWTNDVRASIEFKWDSGSAAHFRMLTGSLGRQRYIISLNGVKRHSGYIDETEELIMFNLDGLWRGINILEFDLPDAHSPSLQDARRLGLSIRHLQFVTPVHSLSSGAEIKYDDHAAEWHNFSTAEDGFRWSTASACHVGFFWDAEPSELEFVLVAVGFGRQRISVICNEKQVYSGSIDAGRPGDETAIALQCRVSVIRGFNVIAFDLPDAHAPGGRDTRLLGIAVNRFRIQHVTPSQEVVSELMES